MAVGGDKFVVEHKLGQDAVFHGAEERSLNAHEQQREEYECGTFSDERGSRQNH